MIWFQPAIGFAPAVDGNHGTLLLWQLRLPRDQLLRRQQPLGDSRRPQGMAPPWKQDQELGLPNQCLVSQILLDIISKICFIDYNLREKGKVSFSVVTFYRDFSSGSWAVFMSFKKTP
jgi:hypothetical protein